MPNIVKRVPKEIQYFGIILESSILFMHCSVIFSELLQIKKFGKTRKVTFAVLQKTPLFSYLVIIDKNFHRG